MDRYVYIGSYLFFVCMLAKEVAKYDSFLKVRVPYSARLPLMIFSFERERISIFCVISQVYAYLMIFLFILSRFISLDFLLLISDDPNALYMNLIKFHVVIIFPIAIIEEGICYLVKRHFCYR